MSFFSSICSIRTPCCNLRLQQYRNKDQYMLSKIQVTTITISKIAFNNNENDTGGGGGGGHDWTTIAPGTCFVYL